MRIRFSDPLDTLLNLQRELDSYLNSDWFGPRTASRGAYPPVNVFRKDGDYVVIAELPGAKKEDLDIQVQRNQLRIAGKRELAYAEGASVHRAERVSGGFDRTITIPSQLDPDSVNAEYRNGILAVYLAPAEEAKPRSVKVA